MPFNQAELDFAEAELDNLFAEFEQLCTMVVNADGLARESILNRMAMVTQEVQDILGDDDDVSR